MPRLHPLHPLHPLRAPRPPHPVHGTPHVPTARDIMTESLVTLAADMSIFEAIRTLISVQISGAPVLDAEGRMVGMLSELDCLGVLASDQFFEDDRMDARVRDYMSTSFETVGPDCDVYTLAQYFRQRTVRRYPVCNSWHNTWGSPTESIFWEHAATSRGCWLR